MIVKYLFSAPKGDILAGPDELASPFKITPLKEHPYLSLRDYFEAIRDFILRDRARPLVALLRDLLHTNLNLDEIYEVLIRTEKHGALYHIASIEIFSGNQPVKLSVSTAVSERGKVLLSNEFEVLDSLNRKFHLPYLPRPYSLREIPCDAGDRGESLLMLLAGWFEDYHEWHLRGEANDDDRKICIWDNKNGYWIASKKECYEIFKQIAKILTLYYDTRDFSQIYPWHHGAGDFIIKREKGQIYTRLTTVRKYEEIMSLVSDDPVNPFVAITYFFLNLTIKIRLDRLDGVGKMVWADEFSVAAAIEGFFEALCLMATENRFHLGSVDDLLALFKSFDSEDLQNIFDSLLSVYQDEDADEEDLRTIKKNLGTHVQQLYKAIQDFRR